MARLVLSLVFLIGVLQGAGAAEDDLRVRLDHLIEVGRSDYPWAVHDLLALRDTCRTLRRDSCLFDIYVNAGLFLEAQGLLDSAMVLYGEGTTILRTLGDSAGVVRMRFMRANNHVLRGEYEQAMALYAAAEDLARSTAPEEMPYLLTFRARLFYEVGDVDAALADLRKAARKYEETGNVIGRTSVLNNMAIVYRAIDQTDSARATLRTVLAINRRAGDSMSMVHNLSNMAAVELDEGEVDSAWAHVESALALSNGVPSPGLVVNLARLADRSGDPDRALRPLEDMWMTHRTSQDLLLRRRLADGLFDAYKALGRSSDALTYLEEARDLDREILDAEKVAAVESARARMELSQKQSEIDLLRESERQRELAQERLIIIYVFTIIVLLALSFAVALMLRTAQFRARSEQADLEQRLLRAQMNPHFIHNMLGSIQTLILEERTDDALDHLRQFSRLVRTILENSRESQVSLRSEWNALNHYIDLQLARFDGGFRAEMDIDLADGDLDQILIPPMLIQPFVENAIEHGLQGRATPGLLSIQIRRIEDTLICVIEDDGIGRAAADQISIPGRSSLSTRISEERLAMISDGAGRLEIDDLSADGRPAGTRVTLYIPITIDV